MFRIPTLTPRQYLIVAHDLIATAVAILASFFIRFEETGLGERLDGLIRFLPGFVVYAGFIYFLFGLHASKWRFSSLPDVFNIVRAATVLAISLLVLDYILVSPQVYGAYFFGKITIALYWFMQIAFLAGSRVDLPPFPLCAHAAVGARRAFAADAGARARRGCRGAAARDRKRRGEPRASGRHSLAVDRRSRPVDARHSGGRQPRRSRAGGARQRGARHAHHAADLHAVRAGRRSRARNRR